MGRREGGAGYKGPLYGGPGRYRAPELEKSGGRPDGWSRRRGLRPWPHRAALPDPGNPPGSWSSRGPLREQSAMGQPSRLLDRRIAAASPNSPVPMTISLAPSGTSGSDVTAAVVVATIG